jgi:hypothetical protein
LELCLLDDWVLLNCGHTVLYLDFRQTYLTVLTALFVLISLIFFFLVLAPLGEESVGRGVRLSCAGSER